MTKRPGPTCSQPWKSRPLNSAWPPTGAGAAPAGAPLPGSAPPPPGVPAQPSPSRTKEIASASRLRRFIIVDWRPVIHPVIDRVISESALSGRIERRVQAALHHLGLHLAVLVRVHAGQDLLQQLAHPR